MRINKRKFFVRIFILISIIGLLIYARYLATHDAERENLFAYYEDLINSLKGNSSTYIVTEKMFSTSIDKTHNNTIVGKNDGVLLVNSNGLAEYTTSSTPNWKQDFLMTNPIVQNLGEWTILGEKNGRKIIAYNFKNEIYNLEIDGEIQKIFVNSNGYVGVIFEKIGYKNAFSFISPKGEVIYTKYFANTTLIDADISKDGKRVIMLEADVNGAVVNSAITVLDNKADTLNSSIKKNTILVGAHFIDDKALIVGDNSIVILDNSYNEEIFSEINIESTIGLVVNDEKIVRLYEDTNELFANKTLIEVKDVNGKVIGQAEVTGIAHSLEVQNKTIAVVLSDRIDFLTTKGHYISSIFISGDYKDIELFNKGSYASIQTNDEIAIYKIK